MAELMKQEEFDKWVWSIDEQTSHETVISAYATALARIEVLEAERRWVPASERLPEKPGRYLVITDLDPLQPVERLYYPGVPYPWGYMFAEVIYWITEPLPPVPAPE